MRMVTTTEVYKMYMMVDHNVREEVIPCFLCQPLCALNLAERVGVGMCVCVYCEERLKGSRQVSLTAYQLYTTGISQTLSIHTNFHIHICSTKECHQGEL